MGVYQNSADVEGTCTTDAKAEGFIGVSRFAWVGGDMGSFGYQGISIRLYAVGDSKLTLAAA